jgi:hypothetical protein
MAADQPDLEEHAAADLEEMRAALPAASSTHAPALIELDLYSRPGAFRFEVSAAGIPAQPTGPEPTALPAERLRAFLLESIRDHPAEHYALVMWGHGQGWRPKKPPHAPFRESAFQGGLAFDASDDTVLDIPSLAEVLRDVSAKALEGRAFDLVIGDACLMETLEIALELDGAAQYLIGSEQIEAYAGLPYDRLLPWFHRGTDARRIAADLPTAHLDSLAADPAAKETATSAALDLARAGELLRALEDVAASLTAALDRDEMVAIDHAQALSSRGIPHFLGGTRDIGLFLQRARSLAAAETDEDLERAVARAETALEAAVVAAKLGDRYRGANYQGIAGISLWLPFDAEDFARRGPDYAASRVHRPGGPIHLWLSKLSQSQNQPPEAQQ